MNFMTFSINEKKDITFICTATGTPVPSISFWREGHVLNYTGGESATLGKALADRVMLGNEIVSLNSSTHLHVVTQSLTLFNAVDTDSGHYLCLSSADIPGIGLRLENVTFSLTVNGEFWYLISTHKYYLHNSQHNFIPCWISVMCKLYSYHVGLDFVINIYVSRV